MTLEQPRGRWRKYLQHASRSRGFLWRLAIGLILAGGAVGFILSRLHPSTPDYFGERVLSAVNDEEADRWSESHPEQKKDIFPALEQELANPAVRFADVMGFVPRLAPWVENDAGVERFRTLLRQRFTPAEADLAADFLDAFKSDDSNDAQKRLTASADGPTPPRYANYALGRVEMKREHYAAAASHFSKEGERPEAWGSRRMALHALIEGKDFAGVAKLQDQPDYAELITPVISLDLAIGAKDWRGILKWVPITQVVDYDKGILLINLITAFAWMFFLVHLGESPGLFTRSSLLCAAAFVCGVISTTPTVYLVILQDDFLHFSKAGDIYHTFAFFIGGVGLREELCKLLLFVPLLPFLLKREDDFEALIVASFVGLGFAIEENGSYFTESLAASVPGRFLTANFFHVALTGLNGLALFRACRREPGGLNEIFFIFPITVVAHGAYDALLELPETDRGSYASLIVFVGFCIFYFNRARQLRPGRRMTIGLTGSFVFGVSLLAGSVIALQMYQLGPVPGLKVIVPELIGSATMLFMFFREFNEPLSD